MPTTAIARRRNARRHRPVQIHSIPGYATSNGTSDLLDPRFDRVRNRSDGEEIASTLHARGYQFKVKDLQYARHAPHLQTGWAAQEAVNVGAVATERGWASSMSGGGRQVTFGGCLEVTTPSGNVEEFRFDVNGPASYYHYSPGKAVPVQLVAPAIYNCLCAAWDVYPDAAGASDLELLERYLNETADYHGYVAADS